MSEFIVPEAIYAGSGTSAVLLRFLPNYAVGQRKSESQEVKGGCMIGSDFQRTVLTHSRRCGECGKKMIVGDTYLASIKNGKIKKWVCSEDCRLEFDANFWAAAARTNEQRRKK